ncbi:hypothetical protein HZA97_06420 [Candidatus Woesearchaeota archaeon]|nr:hypothetical protein [Candidatus Woesearchaeota archaeon]
MKNKKGAIITETPIELIALAFAALVILSLYVPKIVDWFGEEGQKSICEWTIVAGAIRPIPGKELITPECRHTTKIINKEDLNPYLKEAEETINKWNSNDLYKGIREEFPQADLQNEYKYALNKVVSKELTSCWEKVVRGKLAMFDEWYNRIDLWGSGEPKQLEEYRDKVRAIITVWGAPTFCILCSEIKFNDSLSDLNVPSRIDLNKWLQYTPYDKNKKISSYEYLLEGQTLPSNLVSSSLYDYDVLPPNRYAVIYKRINPHITDPILHVVWSAFEYIDPVAYYHDWVYGENTEEEPPDTLHRLKLVPLEQVAKPASQGGESCYKILE